MSDKYGYIAIETLLDFCENSVDHVVTPNDFMRMARVRVPERKAGRWIERNPQNSPDCRLIECSECGDAYIVSFDIEYDDWIKGRNFCRRCGARLIKEGAQS